MRKIAIQAIDANNGVGAGNELPWNFKDYPEDMRNFRVSTTGNIVVMGRGCFESIGSRPLPHRINIVVSSTLPEDTLEYPHAVVRDIDEALMVAHSLSDSEMPESVRRDCYFIGGPKLLESLHEKNLIEELVLTKIDRVHLADHYYHPPLGLFELLETRELQTTIEGTGVDYSINHYKLK